jgi:hypothetical protein
MFAGPRTKRSLPRFGSLLALDSGGTVLLGSTLPVVPLVLRLLATYPVSGPMAAGPPRGHNPSHADC